MLNTMHSLSHSENCATTWRSGSGWSKKHHRDPSSVINSALIYPDKYRPHSIIISGSLYQYTDSGNKRHNTLDTCWHNKLETPIIFPHRLIEPRNVFGHAVRVRRLKIRRHQHKLFFIAKTDFVHEKRTLKRLFWTGRHTAVMTNGSLPLSRKGSKIGARLQLAELIFPTGTHFTNCPLTRFVKYKTGFVNIVYEHHALFENSVYTINTAVAFVSFRRFFNFFLHTA